MICLNAVMIQRYPVITMGKYRPMDKPIATSCDNVKTAGIKAHEHIAGRLNPPGSITGNKKKQPSPVKNNNPHCCKNNSTLLILKFDTILEAINPNITMEEPMPVITVTLGKGQANREQKQELIQSVTKVAVEATQIPARSFTILISELDSDNIGIAGQTLTQIQASQKP